MNINERIERVRAEYHPYVCGVEDYWASMREDAEALADEVERLRLLTAAGDDLCRLTKEEIDQYANGTVKIPPKEEFLASCERFHAQMANESGVMEECLTLAQLVEENEQLRCALHSEDDLPLLKRWTELVPKYHELKTENERLRKALKDVKRHQELIGGGNRLLPSTTWKIADKGLKGES